MLGLQGEARLQVAQHSPEHSESPGRGKHVHYVLFILLSQLGLQGEDAAAEHLVGGEVVNHLLDPLLRVFFQLPHDGLGALLLH